MGRPLNIVVVGVGGQGLITLSTIIAQAALARGYNAIVAETHGLSQRGGTVIVHVRLGRAEAPLIPPGTGDVMIAMELIEAARYTSYLRAGAAVVANDYITPPPLPKIQIPSRQQLIEAIKTRTPNITLVQATSEALKLGDPRTANMILLGAALARGLLEPYVDMEAAKKAVAARWPRAAEANTRALEHGAKLASPQT